MYLDTMCLGYHALPSGILSPDSSSTYVVGLHAIFNLCNSFSSGGLLLVISMLRQSGTSSVFESPGTYSHVYSS